MPDALLYYLIAAQVIRAVMYGLLGDVRRCGATYPLFACLVMPPVVGDILCATIILSSDKKPG